MESPLLAGTPNSPPSEVDGSLHKNISNIISMLDSPVAGTTPTDTDALPATQPVDQRVLKDVVAYVEVRSQNENRSRCIIRELTQLGAEVVPKFTNEVTHVIFKDGKKATRDKAQKKGIHLVSVLWVDSCKQNQSHVSENLFQPVLPENDGTPIIISRLKKTKSMQPKDFDEDVANSAERGKNRRRRQANADKWKILETPYSPHMPRTVYAAETQPMSPFSMDMSFSPGITVPDTPPSMRRKLQELRRRQANQGDSDVDPVSTPQHTEKLTPLQRRLFEGNLSGMLSGPGSPQTPTPRVPPRLNLAALKQASATTSIREATSSESDSSDPNARDKPGKKKHKLYPANHDAVPPPELLKPTKATNTMQNKPKLFEPSARNPARKRQKSAESGSDDNAGRQQTKSGTDSDRSDSNLQGKSKPKKRVRLTETELLSKDPKDETPATPAGILRVKRTTRRQSIASSTPTQVAEGSDTGTKAKRRGRRSMAVLTTSDTTPTPSATSDQAADPPAADAKSSDDKNCTTKTVSNNTYKVQLDDPLQIDSPKTKVDAAKVARRRSVRIGRRDSFMPVEAIQEEARNCKITGRKNTDNSKSEKTLSTPGTSQDCSASTGSEIRPQGKCFADFDSTADDSLILPPPRKRFLKIVSSARKRKPSSDSENEESSLNLKTSQTPNKKGKYSGMTCLSHSRKSLEDFHPSQFNIPSSKKLTAMRKVSIETSEDGESMNEPRRKVRKTSTAKAARSSSTSSEDSRSGSQRSKKSKKPKQSLVITSMHAEDRDVIYSIIKKLGGYHVVSDVTDSTTHVICGDARRTLSVLYAIARGTWLLSKEWVLESLEAGKWLDEEPFEIHDYFPAAQKRRLERLASGATGFTTDIFSECGNIFVTDQTKPPHHHLVALLKLAGGQVTHCVRKADLCIGQGVRPDQDAVSEQWLLDSITSYRCLPYSNYTIDDNSRTREASPDF